ncbi:MAG: GNAT family N-acetyltransferase [Chloroflexi bacterium]|nr:MAG: GNAT family N-acetyltransferase [Chloroflexota bacterium]
MVMMEIYQVESSEHKQHVRELFWEYLQWANQKVNETFHVNFDIAAMLEDDMQTLAKFLPPDGRLLLGEIDEQIAGLACMKQLTETSCEIKRMYVRPVFRGRGVGRALSRRLIDDARQMDYPIIRLDSARFMDAAHALYRSVGFQEIAPYEGSEIPAEFHQHWIFMELRLR